MSYNRHRPLSRWMTIRHGGRCKVCGNVIPAGTSAFWDASAKRLTCHDIDCCEKDGLATHSALTGPWDKRTDTRVRLDHRIGKPYIQPE